MSKPLTHDEIAEFVGYYFGLQRACNLKPDVAHLIRQSAEHADTVGQTVNAYRRELLAQMKDVEAKLPPGTLEAWPRAPLV
jgi:hypothetical protein